MGQRFVIEVEYNDTTLLAVYWHWDGFTGSEITDMAKMYRALRPYAAKSKVDVYEIASAICKEFPGSGIKGDGPKATIAKEQKQLPVATNRNEGLIAIDPEEIRSMMVWAESSSSIALDIDDTFRPSDHYMFETVESLQEMGWTTEEITAFPIAPPIINEDIGFRNIDEFFTILIQFCEEHYNEIYAIDEKREMFLTPIA